MTTRTLIAATLLGALLPMAHAVQIVPFPGLKGAIEQADVIAIVRIDEHVKQASGPDLLTAHRCYVYQVLKGDLTAGGTVLLKLMDTRTRFVSPFPLLSAHLVFLVKTDDGYRNLAFEG